MKTYNLKILYPSSNSYLIDTCSQSYNKIVVADKVVIREGTLEFLKQVNASEWKTVAVYPVMFTIIESINEQ